MRLWRPGPQGRWVIGSGAERTRGAERERTGEKNGKGRKEMEAKEKVIY